MIYLDNAATTPLSPSVLKIVQDTNTKLFANNSSIHVAGKTAREALESARFSLSNIFGVNTSGLYFTSGATESINMLLQGYCKQLLRNGSTRNQIVISKIEHPAVHETVHYLKTLGFIIHELQNDNFGRVLVDDLNSYINHNTAIVAVMAVNNETGVVQDIENLINIVKSFDEKILFFTDTVQALGKISTTKITKMADGFCGSAHKVGGPKGVGFLFVKPEFRILPLTYGGDQEHSLRPGTTNVPGINLMSAAFADRNINFTINFEHVTSLNKYLEECLKNKKINFRRTIPFEYTSPYIFSVLLPMNSDRLLEELSKREICISKRSACSSQSHSKSRILESIFIDHDEIDRIVRVSFSPESTKSEIDVFVENLVDIL